MLEKRVYSRSELIEIFKTDRLDAIQKKIQRAGYVYSDAGRGKSYTMEILDLPRLDEFKQYCIETLKFSPQTDFQKLKVFLYCFLADDDFPSLQYNEMAAVIRADPYKVAISAQTVSNYFQHLQDLGWCGADYFDYVYFIYDPIEKKNRYITKDEYKAIYKEFWQIVRANNGDFKRAYEYVRRIYGNAPRKRPQQVKTAFVHTQYDTVWYLIEKDFEKKTEKE